MTKPKPKQFEYRQRPISIIDTDFLNQEGSVGWQVVDIREMGWKQDPGLLANGKQPEKLGELYFGYVVLFMRQIGG